MNAALSSSDLLFVILGESPDFRQAAESGIKYSFPVAKRVNAVSLTEAVELSSRVGEAVLLLLEPSADQIAGAVKSLDSTGLPLWALVVFTSGFLSDEVVTITHGNGSPPLVGKALQLARALHRLRCENARYRGDLLTIGTRVAHDLRSPLGGVLTTVEVLKEVLAEDAPQRVALLEPILESTDGLTKLIRQLSFLTKASGSENSRQIFAMGLAFWGAFQRVEREAVGLGATIVQPAAWPEVRGDQSWVEAIWHALLSNSLRYGGPKPRIEVGWTLQENETRFWVMDSGEVSLAKRPALFTPFHLLHQPNAPRGFGLAIVRRLAELQGGKCGYESVPTGGSCFFFTLPNEKDLGGDSVSHPSHAKA